MIGCYPGSFNPPTVAHLAVAEAAVRAAGLTRLDLVVSRVALGKEDLPADTLAERVAVLEAVAPGGQGWPGRDAERAAMPVTASVRFRSSLRIQNACSKSR